MIARPFATLLTGFVSCLVPLIAHAQAPVAAPASSSQTGFLTTYQFHLNAMSFQTDDRRFTWDTDFGGDVDLVDYGVGRVNFLANYEAILGEELRPFDPIQGNYTLDFLASGRSRNTEIAGVFHHVSRHLGDRAKLTPVSWNMVGVQFGGHGRRAGWDLTATARAFWVTQRSFVDYRGQFDAQLSAVSRVTSGIALTGNAGFDRFLTTRDIANRSAQTGGHADFGVRFLGQRGSLDLFIGVERRVDADPFDHLSPSWAVIGFRLLSR